MGGITVVLCKVLFDALVRLQTWSLTALGEGMNIFCIKDHVRSSINDFRERIRAITNTSFAVGRLN